MKLKTLPVLLLASAFLFSGCEDEGGEEETNAAVGAADRGWHFQGRDCQACHNYDLGTQEHLVLAGTLFKNGSVPDPDDLRNSCNADLAIQLVDSGFNVVYDTGDYYDPDSKGNRGQGNVFLLSRRFDSTVNGTYTVRIVQRTTGLLLAQSNLDTHSFSGAEYDIGNSADYGNRLSCNACHDGTTTPHLYVQTNYEICQ